MSLRIKHILEQVDQVIQSSNLPDHDSALNGVAGLAMYQFYIGKVLEDEDKVQKGGEILGAIFERLSTGTTTLTGHALSTGITGLCLTLSSLVQDECIDFNLEENVSNYDDYLIEKSREELAIKSVDFLSQALGVVYYFTTRVITPKTQAALETFVDDILKASVMDENGMRFLNSSGPRSGTSYDLSIAHGLAGILLILLKIYNLGIKQDDLKPFIYQGIQYILAFYIENPDSEKHQSLFPLGVNKDANNPEYSNMLAWCYGDLNQLILLTKASKSFETNEWDEIIQNVTTIVCTRSLEKSVIRDSHFCHGASGVTYVFQYLYDFTGDKAFLKAKDYWLNITINQLEKELTEFHYKNKETQLLEGLVGVAFVLLSELYPKRLAWSKLLLM